MRLREIAYQVLQKEARFRLGGGRGGSPGARPITSFLSSVFNLAHDLNLSIISGRRSIGYRHYLHLALSNKSPDSLGEGSRVVNRLCGNEMQIKVGGFVITLE